jgi:hypothetical protein
VWWSASGEGRENERRKQPFMFDIFISHISRWMMGVRSKSHHIEYWMKSVNCWCSVCIVPKASCEVIRSAYRRIPPLTEKSYRAWGDNFPLEGSEVDEDVPICLQNHWSSGSSICSRIRKHIGDNHFTWHSPSSSFFTPVNSYRLVAARWYAGGSVQFWILSAESRTYQLNWKEQHIIPNLRQSNTVRNRHIAMKSLFFSVISARRTLKTHIDIWMGWFQSQCRHSRNYRPFTRVGIECPFRCTAVKFAGLPCDEPLLCFTGLNETMNHVSHQHPSWVRWRNGLRQFRRMEL